MKLLTNFPDSTLLGRGVASLDRRITTPGAFSLLENGFRPELIGVEMAAALKQKLVLITGGLCVGKTELVRGLGLRQLAEVKTRALREGEVVGRDIIPVSIDSFLALHEKESFFLAYRANLDERGQLVGILLSTLQSIAQRPNRSCMIVHPAAATLIDTRIQGVPIIALWAEDEDRECFCTMRKHPLPQSPHVDDQVILPGTACFVQNRCGKFGETLREAQEYLGIS